MTEVILHIGPHKTGTTAIQEYLSGHHDRLLAEAGIDFPRLGRLERGSLGSQAHRHFSSWMRGQNHACPPGFAAAWRAYQSPAPLCIISSESFYLGSTDTQIARIFELVPDISRIVFFLRDPVAHVASMHGEGLKGWHATGLSGFVEEHFEAMRDLHTPFAYYRYEENIARWAKYAPVVEVPYDPAGDILAAFFAAAAPGFDHRSLGGELARMNVAAPRLVKALQHSLNRSFAAERLELEAFRALKKRLSRKGAGCFEDRYAGRLTEVVTPTRRFAKVFRARNPRLAGLCDRSPRQVTSWELPPALDAQVIADMQA